MNLDIGHQRLHNQHLAYNPLEKPEDVVGWLGVVQSQDYAGAKWAIAQRTSGNITNAELEALFSSGAILRTHVLRPTWHFVAPSDIRWMLKLTSSRVQALNDHYYRKVELDAKILERITKIITKALQGHNYLTRAELAKFLEAEQIVSNGLRLYYIMMHAELEGFICSGPLRGKLFTYALLEEYVPPTKTLERDEALAALARRYFASHGPATLQDYAWWSGLSLADCKAGLETVKAAFESQVIDSKTYWFSSPTTTQLKEPTLRLLPNYDEHFVAYKDHSASFEAAVFKELKPNDDALVSYIIVLNGYVIGGWHRVIGKKEITITTKLLVSLNEAEQEALKSEAAQYGRFMDMPVNLVP